MWRQCIAAVSRACKFPCGVPAYRRERTTGNSIGRMTSAREGKMSISERALASAVAAALSMAVGAAALPAMQVTDWSPAVNAETVIGTDDFNTTFLDGCPAPSPNGLEFYMASNRQTDSHGQPAGMGGIDIW